MRAMGAGLGGSAEAGREIHLAYVLPGVLLMGIATAAQGVAITVSMDMTEGIVARFRTMAISRSAVLAGHVASSMLQTAISVALVIGVGMLIGFRPAADALGWLAAAGLLGAITLAVTWLSVGCGLVIKSVEAASNLPMPLMLLPFLGSGFVPAESLPAGMRWFAEHQPFTPIIETVRSLLMAEPVGDVWIRAVVWCGVIGIAGYAWSMRLYDRRVVG
jgi:ABC-2 type transport system permease protein